ncbi:hypothetical protein D3Z42_02225 [Lachnospiraceae bacterium]|nr:hypothetical protein [Lachnospiraceae bacterium]NBI74304.1 hypothetical protein [Lachnospiraceae bacterium]
MFLLGYRLPADTLTFYRAEPVQKLKILSGERGVNMEELIKGIMQVVQESYMSKSSDESRRAVLEVKESEGGGERNGQNPFKGQGSICRNLKM